MNRVLVGAIALVVLAGLLFASYRVATTIRTAVLNRSNVPTTGTIRGASNSATPSAVANTGTFSPLPSASSGGFVNTLPTASFSPLPLTASAQPQASANPSGFGSMPQTGGQLPATGL